MTFGRLAADVDCALRFLLSINEVISVILGRERLADGLDAADL